MSNTKFPIARSNDSEKLLDRVATKTAPKPKTKRKDESGANVKFNHKLITPDADYL